MSSFVRTVRWNGRELRVRVEQAGSTWRIQTGNDDAGSIREASVVEVEPGVYSILLEGRSFEIWAAGLKAEVDDPRAPRMAARHVGLEGRQSVTAPMPGKVVRVLVQEGDNVERGQGLVVMEAMKMQNELKSPKQGRVVAVGAAVGATVAAGDVLATVE